MESIKQVNSPTKTAALHDEIIALTSVFLLFGFSVFSHRLQITWIAISVTLAFALGGWLLRGVTGNGTIAGGIIAFIFYTSSGWRMFALLFFVFLLTWFATRVGSDKKVALNHQESFSKRSAAQVTANLLAAAALLVFVGAIHVVIGNLAVTLGAAIAALVEATADTVSSEIGKGFGKHTVLITSFQSVERGTSGGISLLGTLGGAVAGGIIVAFAFFLGILNERWMVIVLAAGLAGTVVDSLLGATFERRRWIGNNTVNLMGTASAAAIVFIVGIAWFR